MVSPERRACSRAAVRDFSDGSIPVTLAPSAASVSARMPPPQPTSRTRFPPNPPSTRRKYSTRTAFSSCSPANGPSSLHHTPGTRSTRRSYFSGSERPPRRGSCSDMGTNLWRGGSWGSTEFFGAAACRAFDDVHGGGERRASRLRGEPVALVIWESFCDPVDRQGEFVTFAPRMKPFVPGHARKNTGWRTWSWDRFGAWRVTTTRSTSPNLPQPPQPAPASIRQSLPRWGTAAPRGTTAPPGASSCPPRRATGQPRAPRWQPAGAPHGYGARIRWHSFPP